MPVQWVHGKRRPLGPQFLRCPPDQIVQFLSTPDEHAVIILHWCDEVRESVPCMGKPDCRFCDRVKKVHAYTGLLVYSSKTGQWSRAICDLGHPSEGLAQTDHRGSPIKIGKAKELRDRHRIISYGADLPSDVTDPPKMAPWDVRPHLLRRWGLFAEADECEREPYYEQKRLQFPFGAGSAEETA